MKKALLVLPFAMLMLSCAALKPGYINISDYSERMDILKYAFPEVYDMYRAGRITITKMYIYHDKTGDEVVKVKYNYL